MGKLRAFVRNKDANVALSSGLLISVLLGMGAFGVDVGRMFADRRKAQSTADLAAMAAATDLLNATKAASATVQQNSFASTALQQVVIGTYTADASVAPGSRFKPASGASANAAQVSLQTATPLFLGRLLAGKDHFDVTTKATATQTAFASFAVGSGLLSIQNGVLNQLLGSMLGANITLSAMDYQSLLNVNVSMFSFANSLASRINMTAGNYSTLFNSSVKVADVMNAIVDTSRATYGNSSSVQALNSIASAINTSTTKIPLASLLNFGPYGSLSIGQNPQVNFAANALDFVSAMAQLANGQNQAAVALDVNLPGIASATLALTVGERPVGTSWMAVGGAGASVHTAQTRLLLTVTLLGSGSIASVTLPIYLELASATATLNAVQCSYQSPASSSVTIGVTPAVLDSWIGNVTPALMKNFSSPLNPGDATLISLPLLSVKGRAHATISNLSSTNLTFNANDISQQTKKTVSTTDYTSSLVSKLIADLDLTVSIGGLGLGLPGVLQSTVAGIVAGATQPIDQLLASVLASLGVQLGQAQVWTTGIRCDGAVLVN